jgi:hypothetical protein
VPLYLSQRLLLSYIRLEIEPHLAGQEVVQNSMPTLATSEKLFTLAVAWLALVIAGWVIVLMR